MRESREHAGSKVGVRSSSLFTKCHKQLQLDTTPQHARHDVEVSLKAAIAAARHHAELSASEGRLAEALRRREDVVRQEQVKFSKNAYGDNNIPLCEALHELALAQYDVGDYEVGEEEQRRGMTPSAEITVNNHAGATDVSIVQGETPFSGRETFTFSGEGDVFLQLCNILLGLGNCHGALRNFVSAHKSYDLARKVGKECEAVPSLLVNKASLLRVYVNSVNIWSWQALLCRYNLLGNCRGSSVASDIEHNLACCLHHKLNSLSLCFKLDEALKLFKEAAAIRTSILGSDHPLSKAADSSFKVANKELLRCGGGGSRAGGGERLSGGKLQ
ncbi:hypothetical protein GUITHDRAFT_141630 [Guillardia theta CCMP2712]|uniref:Kinesin light chain n=1 Tax=Guillardia theta (strain CCMP2712) TaxID=905079 RepID=L1J0Q7_GUITC|nr:hypothetical protein GUITHDRAFT_141630 [Guillardia theta CCMP2712]EKX41877.1 hypothetical protein GUITHDRAFT_141630 [Guillardia theta CCMP2712]|eukprot:XP_005828857.1 hypothetical protein GUITHDRAFT_141630 [Guillardia theta CCMP2712]